MNKHMKFPLSLILIAGIVVVLFGLFISDLPAMVVSGGWPITEGRVIINRLVGRSIKEYDGDYYTEPQVYIRYQYVVDGISYSSSRLNAITPPFFLYSTDFADQYPLGKDLIVFYKPGNPAVAVLEPGFVFDLGAFDIFSTLMIGSGIYILFRFWKGQVSKKRFEYI